MKTSVLILVWLASAGSAVAMTPTTPSRFDGKLGPMPTTSSGAASNGMADDSAGLRRGTIEQVNVSGGSFHVYRQRLTFDPQRVKVFGKDGKPASVGSLRAGSRVRFTMDPADRQHRRVAVIYID